MKNLTMMKRMFAFVAFFAIIATASAQWTTYDASTLPGDADWNVKNGAGDAAVISLVDDAENSGNKILQFISGEADKNTLEAPKFDSKVSGGGTKQAFTVVMRARAYKFSEDSTYKNFMEVEVKDGEIRDKARFYTEKGLDIEKANSKELKAYPEGHDSYEFNIYRITFKDGITKVWINDVLVDESVAASPTTSDSDSRFVIGDSNTGADYGTEYDWIIWDNGDAYAPGEGADYPVELILAPLSGDVDEGNWDIYDASETPEAFGFSAGGSNTVGSSTIIDDTENAGNKILDMRSGHADKWYWSSNNLTDVDPDAGFTVIYRMSGITTDSASVGEMEVALGGFRDKVRVYGSDQINIEKAGITESFPEGVSAMDFNVYRVTFQRHVEGEDTMGYTRVWINDVFVAEGYTTTTSTSKKYTIGDSNSGKSYAAFIDWIIRDETGAYAPHENSNYPNSLVLDPLKGGVIVVPDILKFNDVSIAVDQAGETVTADLEANAAWIVASADTWFEISPVAGDSGVASITIIAEPNTGAAPRTGTIYGLIGEEFLDELTVTQEGQAVMIDAVSAVASSAQLKDGAYKDASFAIDGDETTSWVYDGSIDNGSSEWIKVAVATGSEVVLVKIMEYKNNERLTSFSVDYWNGSEYVEILAPQLSPLQSVANSEVAYAFPSTVTTDTIKINFYGNTSTTGTDPTTASGWLTISEVSIWGEESPNAIESVSTVDYSVYPNPSSGSFTIKNAVGANIQVISLSGQVLFSKTNITNLENINLDLNSGIYLLNVGGAVSKIIVD